MSGPSVYFNEINEYKAQWLRNLIDAGRLPKGSVVDTRSIEDVRPDDVRGFDRCHFFAGIGGWGLALTRADWPTSSGVVWTCGCPCQPFSAAGKRAGFADERHLWPAQHWLVDQCRPDVLLGEQVASSDALAWLDLVSSDMEGSGYSGGATDLCVAGFGGPQIRQRLWLTFGLADADGARLEGRGVRSSGADQLAAGAGGVAGGLANDALGGRREEHPHAGRRDARNRAEGLAAGLYPSCDAGWLADTQGNGAAHQPRLAQSKNERWAPKLKRLGDGAGSRTSDGAGATRTSLDGSLSASAFRGGGPDGADKADTRWSAADWLYCSDGKWRPVEPGLEPLAHGVPGRVGRLRAYGETISPVVAEAVARAYLEIRP